ncbi:TPA: RHS repeat-associated core domain-containing protein [Stenotrophomonas maltophilia]
MNGLSSLLIRAVLAVVVLVACVAPAVAQEVVEYIHTDALGSPVAITDAGGNVIERTVYEPYGVVVNRPLKDGPGYTGHVTDSGTGLIYMQQRYFDPSTGVFLSVDPVAADTVTGGNFARYLYANGNPYKYADPDGRIGKLIAELIKKILPKILPKASPKPAPKAAPKGSPRTEKKPDSSKPESAGGEGSGNRFPDRDLPRDQHGNPTPDPGAKGPHTQLGQKDGRKSRYDQAREFDGDGKPVKDIDFTDHGRPSQHVNPHEHPYVPNKTGGTPMRGDERPLNGG